MQLVFDPSASEITKRKRLSREMLRRYFLLNSILAHHIMGLFRLQGKFFG